MVTIMMGGVGGVGHVIIVGSSPSVSASVSLLVLHSVSETLSSCPSNSKTTTSSGSVNEGEGKDVDSNHPGLYCSQQEKDIKANWSVWYDIHISVIQQLLLTMDNKIYLKPSQLLY